MEFSVNETKFSNTLDFSDKITIKSSNKNYDVFYSNKNLDTLVKETYEENDFIFIDRNVYNLSPDSFTNLLDNTLIFDAIENNKNIEHVLILIDILLNKKFTRSNKVIVIGGGITQEVGGFASAIYKRGLNWVLIPTTILAMTDSCIGSKVSINRNSKNMLGLFVAPNKIYISDYFLKSLKNDEIISGLGESLKLSLIGGYNTFEYFKEKLLEKDYINIIKMSSLVKKEIIEYDEFENNERKVLNYGHTIGHAIESVTDYFIPHGIAVIIGMYIKNKVFYEDKYNEINDLILSLVDNKFFNIEFNYDKFIEHILSDKKNKGNNICFILLEDIGKSIFIYKTKDEVDNKLKFVLSDLFNKIT
jgi:3-dehydroquinate synthase